MDVFDKERHAYFRDGVWVPSFTQTLDFYSITKVGPFFAREHARIRGDIVHRMIEDSEHGEEEPEYRLPAGFTEAEIVNRFTAYKLFRSEVPISGLILECWRIGEVDGIAYGVTPDIVCRMSGRPCVIETKNTYQPEATHSIQTAAQVIAVEQDKTPDAWAKWLRFGLYLKQDGSYRLKAHRDMSDFYSWRKLLSGHETARALRGEKVWSAQSVTNPSNPLTDSAPIAGVPTGSVVNPNP